ncbi:MULTISPECIES: lipopolysaccharide biosynthesis protein [Clostridia]|jgi:O-antigen/teichoic acid export membrane protein|uniref:lipopolysaccharide biosynthesis protein n=1 Tax=Clostridia TaxID=186801 RepID=UPI000E5D7372|nr:hypothetical protein [Eubacterium sp. AF22-9]RGS34132.1 hypothetical protein DWY02_01870 [Eubacterium sp. AF22-9]HAS05575.1 hypothetical protein [Eubacterium sp.]HCO35758.1 hypothetical protein [Eubacterium sp.]
MKIPDKLKSLTGDFMYSMMGLIVMNGVIQLVLYPFFNRQLGADQFGVVLTLISLVAIMGSTFGTAANYSRMVTSMKEHDSNGDYNIFLCMIAVLSVLVSAAGLLWLKQFSVIVWIGYLALMIFTVLRYYSDVEFRLNLNYKRYFLFYLLISIGYLAGIALFYVTHSWIIAMLCGECLAVFFVMAVGGIYKGKKFKRSEFFKENMRSLMLLSGTELIAAVILNADRLILQAISGGVAVTIFYAATLVGKMVSLVSVPLNGVVIGHLAKYDGTIKKSTFVKLCLGSIAGSILINVVCYGVSYIFVRIMYADIFDMVKPYLWFANLGQVFYFIANTLTVILLRFTDEKYQLVINIVFLIAFVIIAIPMTMVWNLWGMAIALVIVNLIKILMIMIVGCRKI